MPACSPGVRLSRCNFHNSSVPITGPVIMAKGMEIAEQMGLRDFKASNGWISRFVVRYQLQMVVLHGEAADVDVAVAESKMTVLGSSLQQYPPELIFNMDETGLFDATFPQLFLRSAN